MHTKNAELIRNEQRQTAIQLFVGSKCTKYSTGECFWNFRTTYMRHSVQNHLSSCRNLRQLQFCTYFHYRCDFVAIHACRLDALCDKKLITGSPEIGMRKQDFCFIWYVECMTLACNGLGSQFRSIWKSSFQEALTGYDTVNWSDDFFYFKRPNKEVFIFYSLVSHPSRFYSLRPFRIGASTCKSHFNAKTFKLEAARNELTS